jgi:hypothetical protein
MKVTLNLDVCDFILPDGAEEWFNETYVYSDFELEWDCPVMPEIGDDIILNEFIYLPTKYFESPNHFLVIDRIFRSPNLIDLHLKLIG